ncbi:10667_t:CDS:2, partial [Scutellospora calospora]
RTMMMFFVELLHCIHENCEQNESDDNENYDIDRRSLCSEQKGRSPCLKETKVSRSRKWRRTLKTNENTATPCSDWVEILEQENRSVSPPALNSNLEGLLLTEACNLDESDTESSSNVTGSRS